MKHTLWTLAILSPVATEVAAGKEPLKHDHNAQEKQPNVIIIYADDLGYGDLSCYGAQGVTTPNTDRLAAQGIRFTNAHAVAATSTPSRYALLTGHYAWRRNDTGIATGDAAMIIRPEQTTIADIFQQRGYTTGAVGKWHLGLGSETGKQDWNGFITPGPQDIGFDYSYLMAATGDRVPCVFVENQRIVNLDPNDPVEVSYKTPFPGEPLGKTHPELLTKLKPSHGHDMAIVNGISRIGYMKGGKSALWVDENIADSIACKSVEFIEKHKAEPFFLYVGTNDVHVPRYPHERFRGKSPMGLRGEAILQFDYTVGLIADALDSLGIDDYLVDIGGEMTAKGVNPKGLPWHIGINKPVDDSTQTNNEIQQIIELSDRRGIATSGDYRNFFYYNNKRYSHTISPKTGYPVEHNLASATVFDKTCAKADALATAIMAMGEKQGLQFANDNKLFVILFVREEGNEYKALLSNEAKKQLEE